MSSFLDVMARGATLDAKTPYLSSWGLLHFDRQDGLQAAKVPFSLGHCEYVRGTPRHSRCNKTSPRGESACKPVMAKERSD
jgi:hypothetical protein